MIGKNFILGVDYTRVIKLSAVALVSGSVFGFFIFPKILKFGMKQASAFHRMPKQISTCDLFSDFPQQLQLKPGTKMREMFVTIPFPLDFKVNVFNITNPDEVITGGKPIVQEIGPYYFE